jgi:hypothetical protein
MPANGRWDLIRRLKVNIILHRQFAPAALWSALVQTYEVIYSRVKSKGALKVC